MNTDKTHKSKVSPFLLAIVILLFILPIYNLIRNWSSDIQSLIILLLLSCLGLLTVDLLARTSYTIRDHFLIIQTGVFKSKPIDIYSFNELSNSSSIISAPASSFDRIEISYAKYDTLILSPADKQAFANDLLEVNPKLIIKL